MITTIQELEREIDQFHRNVKDSNELMKILMSVASLTKTQTESMEAHSRALQDELNQLPPELSGLFLKKVEEFIQTVRDEHMAYQTAVAKIMDGYADKFAKAGSAVEKVPHSLEELLRENNFENAAKLTKAQEQYAAELARTNGEFEKQLQTTVGNIQAITDQIKDNSDQQYSAFLKELEKMVDVYLTRLSETEKSVVDLGQQLDAKYDAFVAKLEATNVDQLYKYCQGMNKSLNTKLLLALCGVAIAVVVSFISLFI